MGRRRRRQRKERRRARQTDQSTRTKRPSAAPACRRLDSTESVARRTVAAGLAATSDLVHSPGKRVKLFVVSRRGVGKGDSMEGVGTAEIL